MDTHISRRRMITSAMAASGGIAIGALATHRAVAQATPATASPVAEPGTVIQPEWDPYAYLGSLPTFTVTSTDVRDGEEMATPHRSGIFGAGGEDLSPQLSWSGQPDGTMSYIVTMLDPDAPSPTGFWHWAVFNIPGDTVELPSGAGAADSTALPTGSIQLPNDARLAQYLGPAPPPGPSHRYIIAVLALDVATLDVAEDATPSLLNATASANILAYGLLTPIATTTS